MKIAIVIGSVWATRKDERLSPCKLLIVHTVNL
ncbi:MAG: EutN/CcmL family microcompartment protein, partial [Oscillospiraceae bacterium]